MGKKKKKTLPISILQWNCRSLGTNMLQFTNHINQNSYSVIALQSLGIDAFHLPKLDNYFYPPLYTYSKNDKRIMTAIYVHTDLQYTNFKLSFLGKSEADPPPLDGFYYTGVTIKFKNQLICNILSVYYPTGPNNNIPTG